MSPGLRVGLFLAPVFAAAAMTTAFLPAYLLAAGLDAVAIGSLLAVSTVVRMLAVPVWGAIADRGGNVSGTLLAASCLAGVASLLLLPAGSFWVLLMVACLQGAGAASLMPLADAVSLALSARGRLDYGRVRGAASGCYTAASLAGGWLVGVFGPRVVPVFCGLGYLLAAGATRLIAAETATARRAGLAGIPRLFLNRPFVLTLTASALSQGSHAALYALSTLHWQANGLSSGMIGVFWAEGLLVESLVFLFCRPLADRIGPARLTALSAGLAVVRWLVTGSTTAALPLLLVQPLHGVIFASQHLSAMQILSRQLPPERAGAAQTLYAALGGALPVSVFTVIAGHLYDGTGHVWLLMAGIAACGLVIAPALSAAIARRSPPAPGR